jgi:hypothetical protein
MNELTLGLALLGVIASCALMLTVSLISTAAQFRRALCRLEAVLPQAQCALEEARRALRQSRKLLNRGDNAGRHVEAVVLRACDVATEALERLGEMRKAATHLFTMRTRNGARGGPRSHRRRVV